MPHTQSVERFWVGREVVIKTILAFLKRFFLFLFLYTKFIGSLWSETRRLFTSYKRVIQFLSSLFCFARVQETPLPYQSHNKVINLSHVPFPTWRKEERNGAEKTTSKKIKRDHGTLMLLKRQTEKRRDIQKRKKEKHKEKVWKDIKEKNTIHTCVGR